MERTATADTTEEHSPAAPRTPLPRTGDLRASGTGCLLDTGTGDLLDALPAQPGPTRPDPRAAVSVVPALPAAPVPSTLSTPSAQAPRRPRTAAARFEAVPARFRAARAGFRPWRLFPTPTGTPFTFGYAVVLAVTSLIARYADPALVDALQQSSSTDVAHLLSDPGTVLLASALWVAGGFASPFVCGFLLVLTALERRTGAWCAAAVFLLGHILATLLTEGTVGIAVLVGHLPESSLHRLDYGISFGVAASVGALAGLLTSWLRWPLLALFGGMLGEDLLQFSDPMTNWGHLIALAIGVATWPLLRRWRQTRTRPPVPAAPAVSAATTAPAAVPAAPAASAGSCASAASGARARH
ncbi:rhomboid-like protein [Streptomyces sp. NPDC047000]|uniref:rhomboid-like protein n=1 Tax=Streptomyces sp. NPDC047000 TaxID=3155474 RepID=UPI0033EADEA5